MKKLLCLLSIALIYFQSCGQNKTEEEFNLGAEVQYPIDLDQAFKEIEKLANIRSVLVSLNDTLIAEQYFAPFPPDSLEHSRSVTKSVMATLIGIAIDKGIIKEVDESIVKYIGNAAEGKEKITIKHLLTMTSGIKWREVLGNMEIDEWIQSPSPLQYVLDKSVTYPPGTRWEYSTGIIHLLSVILTNSSGMSTLDFAKKHLFAPLGIDSVKWQLLNDGYYHGGSRLQLKPRDMLKIGQLYENGGLYKGKRILSESFVKAATSRQQPKDSFDEDDGYGYAWWIGKEGDLEGFAAIGYGGQTIFVVPAHHIVIVVTHKWKVSGEKASQQETEAINVVALSILEAMFKK